MTGPASSISSSLRRSVAIFSNLSRSTSVFIARAKRCARAICSSRNSLVLGMASFGPMTCTVGQCAKRDFVAAHSLLGREQSLRIRLWRCTTTERKRSPGPAHVLHERVQRAGRSGRPGAVRGQGRRPGSARRARPGDRVARRQAGPIRVGYRPELVDSLGCAHDRPQRSEGAVRLEEGLGFRLEVGTGHPRQVAPASGS